MRVLGVSVDEGDDARVQRFTESNHLTFEVAHDAAGTVERQFAVVGVPTTIVIGRDGRIVWDHTGNIVDVMADARRAVQSAARLP